MPPFPESSDEPFAPLSPGDCDIIVADSDSDRDEASRNSKRQRIEDIARQYKSGQPIYIHSATLRGPFNQGWVNPWRRRSPRSTIPALARQKTARHTPKSTSRRSSGLHTIKDSKLPRQSHISGQSTFAFSTVKNPSEVAKQAKTQTVAAMTNCTTSSPPTPWGSGKKTAFEERTSLDMWQSPPGSRKTDEKRQPKSAMRKTATKVDVSTSPPTRDADSAVVGDDDAQNVDVGQVIDDVMYNFLETWDVHAEAAKAAIE
ncbi:MAG: hypothetical protein M1825_000207 [Sarcosagium campestre]|nr:MAG: hypothetical protein M1825_000207 [Sarcosagium campestre]